MTDIEENRDCFLDILSIETLIVKLNYDIECIFNKSEEYSIKRISKGDKIKIRGKVCGIGDIYSDIIISNCKIL